MMSPEPPPLAASSPLPGAETAPDVVVTCADDSRTTEDEVVRRRGKKRRGKKSGKDALREPEKEIHGFPEPGETQVSAIGDESHNPSTRPSLTGTGLLASGGSFGAAYGPGMAAARAAAEEAARLRSVASSFLDAESLTHLQRDLDLETVECEFDAKRRLALEEAFRLLPKHAKRRVRDRVRDGAGVDAPPANPAADGESQPGSGGLLGIPRVFSLRSARFELPLNSAALNSLTPLEYVTRHVDVCGSSAQLYRRVFNLHREGAHLGPDAQQQQQEQSTAEVMADLDEEPRYLLGERVITALGDVLGRPLSAEEADGLRDRLGWLDAECLSFRTWCGVSALAERLYARTHAAPGVEPPARPELEQADLAGLQRRLARLNPDPRLVTILTEMSHL
ncbi:uncharacterized protein LOC113207054 isoform X2 [Frankliniella occidentalis]|nr:uncharacterized protein LOC113207054 isoform X2 [Frankliniella occidentalis]